MAIYLNLNKMIIRKGMTSKELAEKIGITEANLSHIRTGQIKAVRFSTLNKLCELLECEPGDIIKYRPDDEW